MTDPASLEKIRQDFEEIWRTQTKLYLMELTTKVLGSTNFILLNGLGIDINKRVLQIFVEEATKLIEEGASGCPIPKDCTKKRKRSSIRATKRPMR